MRREFGLTRAEFLRCLDRFDPDWRESDDGHVLLSVPPGWLALHIGEERQRRVGALSLPVLPLEFRFVGVDAVRREAFLRRFDRAFQRGGG